MPTIHNKAKLGEIAETVLMPGDPLRAKYIAENFLSSVKLVNDVRCAYAYTGTYKGKDVSVMASGMGAGSMGIYSHELYFDYDVKNIIRVGSAGGLAPSLSLGDIVFASAVSTDSGYARHLDLPGSFAPSASFDLLKKAEEYCSSKGYPCKVGPIFSGVAFHYPDSFWDKWNQLGILAVEMESAALYINAALAKRNALAMCTISDLIIEKKSLSSYERETTFNNMIETALETV